MTGAIQVLHVRRLDRGQLKALANVRLGGVVLHHVRVIAPDGDEPYIAMPMAPTRGHEGGAKAAGWLPVVDFTNPALFDRVKAAVIEAWRESLT